MNAKTAVRLRTLTVWAIIFLPALSLLCLILHFAVDVPHWDDWGAQGIIYEQLLKGDRNYYSLFFGQSLESRPAFPLLIFAAVGLTVGWHVTIFMVLSWLCAFLTFIALLKLIPGGHAQRPLMFPYVALLTGGLLFSPIQWQNWLWATQLMQFIPPICLALCLWLQTSRRSTGFKVIFCAMLNILATFSPPNGMLCWFLAIPLLPMAFTDWRTAARRQRTTVIAWTVVYLGLAVLTIGFYFADYQKPPDSPSLDAVLQDPVLGLGFFFAWVGAPLVDGLPRMPVGHVHLAVLVGALLLLLFLFALVLLWAKWKRTSYAAVQASWPWICLAGYGIATGAITTAGRAGWGIGNMMAPRYYTHSLWVTIGLVGLVYASWSSGHDRNRRVRDLGFGAVTGVVSLLTLFSWIGGLERMQSFSAHLRQNLLTLRLLDAAPSNPLWRRLIPLSGYRERARFLIDRGILRIEPIGSWIREKIHQPDAGLGGRFRIIAESERSLRLQGWAVLPDRGVPADCVILARTDGLGKIVTGLITEKSRPDIAMMLNNSDALLSGFDDTLEYAFCEKADLLMFAVDVKKRHLYRLDQDHEGSKVVSYTFAYHLDAAEIIGQPQNHVWKEEISLTIGNERRWVLSQHPNSDIVFGNVFVGKGAMLEFGAGIDELAWDRPGDGVMFQISVLDQNSIRTTVFSQWIDPKNNQRDRRWLDNTIDLGGFAGQEIAIRFRTTAGPAGDNRSDWAVWSRPQIVYRSGVCRGGSAGLVSLSFVPGAVRIEHPMADRRLELRGRFGDGRELDLGDHVATRFSSSNPKVIEVLGDGRLIAHREGAVEVVATNGELDARVGVQSDWAPVIPFGVGSPGKGGIVPVLDTASQRPRVGNPDFLLRVSRVVGGAKGVLIAVSDPASKSITAEPRVAPINGNAFPLTVRGPRGGAGRGFANFAVPIPNDPELVGTTAYWQGFFRDKGAELGWSVTNGLIVTVK